jgi:hypothetical protein
VTLASIQFPSQCIFSAELAERNSKYPNMLIRGDHFMPMYWGNPPRVVDGMMNDRLWDADARHPDHAGDYAPQRRLELCVHRRACQVA